MRITKKTGQRQVAGRSDCARCWSRRQSAGATTAHMETRAVLSKSSSGYCAGRGAGQDRTCDTAGWWQERRNTSDRPVSGGQPPGGGNLIAWTYLNQHARARALPDDRAISMS